MFYFTVIIFICLFVFVFLAAALFFIGRNMDSDFGQVISRVGLFNFFAVLSLLLLNFLKLLF